MPNRANQLILDEYLSTYKDARGVVMIKPEKQDSLTQFQMRAKATESNVRVLMVRNRLSTLAFKKLYNQDVSGLFDGSTLILDNVDPIHAAKVAVDLTTTRAGLKIVGGVMDGELCDAAGVKAWSERDDLPTTQSKIAGLLVAPTQAVLSILNSGGQGILGLLEAYNEKREKEGGAAKAS
ncbi:MAG TPA: 50S ribosomal protein L10 [Planctomycetota bacterium]|jgi:large subunit ribosomal protein L10|nr:50S ribosomal protein L10 [Planctomycetota bacterium]